MSGVDYVDTAYLPISGKYRVNIIGVNKKESGKEKRQSIPGLQLIGRKGVTAPQDILVIDLRQPRLLEIVSRGNRYCNVNFPDDLLTD